jgi:uncharacterized membrane protein YheB (UPF0754 family)
MHPSAAAHYQAGLDEELHSNLMRKVCSSLSRPVALLLRKMKTRQLIRVRVRKKSVV